MLIIEYFCSESISVLKVSSLVITYDDKYLYELNGNVVDTTYFGALKRYSMSVTYILYTTRLKDIYS